MYLCTGRVCVSKLTLDPREEVKLVGSEVLGLGVEAFLQALSHAPSAIDVSVTDRANADCRRLGFVGVGVLRRIN